MIFKFNGNVAGNYSTEAFRDAFLELRVGASFLPYVPTGETVVCDLDELDSFEYKDGHLIGSLEFVVTEVKTQVWDYTCTGIDCECKWRGLAIPAAFAFDLLVEPG